MVRDCVRGSLWAKMKRAAVRGRCVAAELLGVRFTAASIGR
jgi:hypothetical protein